MRDVVTTGSARPPARAARRLPETGVLVALAIAAWVTRPAWGPGPPAGDDVMGHLVRADFGISELVAQGRLNGWFPRFYAGYEEFLVYGPGLTWLMAALRAVTIGTLTNAGALTLVVVGSYVGLPVVVAFVARSFGLDRRAAGIAAVLSLLVSSRYGVGVEGLFEVGLVAHQVGAVLFFLALGAFVRIPVDDRRRWVVLAAVATAGLLVTHPVSVPVLVVFLVAGFLSAIVTRRLGLSALWRTALPWLVAAGLAAFWLVPLLAHRDLAGEVSTWATPALHWRVDAIFDGDVVFRPYLAWVVVGAWVYAVVLFRSGATYALALVAVPCAHVLVGQVLARLFEGEVLEQVGNRGLALAGIVATFPLAALLAALSRRAGRVGRLLAVGVAAVLAVVSVAPLRDHVGKYPEPIPQLRAAAGELVTRVPAWARFATQTFPDEADAHVGVPDPDKWLARASGRNSLNGFNTESTSAPVWRTAREIGKTPPAQLAEALARLGVTHVVALSRDFADRLAHSDRFALEWQQAPVSIFALAPLARTPAPESLVSGAVVRAAAVRSARPESVRLEVTTAARARATIAIAWSPKWHAWVDGDPVEPSRTSDGLLAILLPEGTSEVHLEFRSDGWDALGAAISLLTVGLASAWVVRHRRRSRRGEGPQPRPVGEDLPATRRRLRLASWVVLALAVVALAIGVVRIGGDVGPCEERRPPSASAQPAAPTSDDRLGGRRVRLVAVSRVERAIALAAHDDERLYVALQDGYVCALGDPQPVLDLSDAVSTGHEEQGLLGLAIPTDGRHLYVNFTDRRGDTRISEFRLEEGRAVASSRRDLLVVDQPYPNHNGGHLAFAPDGTLFVGLGDGGAVGDPEDRSQSLRSLLGKILRIEPRPGGSRPYGIPGDNPFVGHDGARAEIWALGLRNPWRFSFDSATGDLWIGDVGQLEYEEIDVWRWGTAAGANFGWDRLEGNHPYEGTAPAGAVAPVFEYPHDGGRCAVIGGNVYRGRRLPDLRGAYLFADACSGSVMALRTEAGGTRGDGGGDPQEVVDVEGRISSLGLDAAGEVYVLTLDGGVFRVEPG